nr:hypothetical protein [Nocardia abscessus]
MGSVGPYLVPEIAQVRMNQPDIRMDCVEVITQIRRVRIRDLFVYTLERAGLLAIRSDLVPGTEPRNQERQHP